MIKELTVTEVSEVLGVSEGTVIKNWNKCKDKALSFGIIKEGRGCNAKYIQTISDDNNKIAYDILREFLINECNFNSRTDFDKLIHYIYLALLNSIDEEYHYNNLNYAETIGVSKVSLIEYRKKLTDCGVMKPKRVSKGVYAYLDMDDKYVKCDVDLYDSFNNCIIEEAKRLLEDSYTVNLTDYNDYQRAKEIITTDFDFEELQNRLLNVSSDLKRELIKDTATNISFKNDKDISRFYKIAFYEVSKEWQKELGIKHIKFFPNHIISDFIVKDMQFINIIVDAYVYIQNK